MREPYDYEKEHTVVGTYPPIKGMQLGGGENVTINYIPESPQYWRPIPVYENYRKLFNGENPYWIPNCGWFDCEVEMFRPRQHPDNMGNHQCLDGGDCPDYEALGPVVEGWFNIPLTWEPKSMGATVMPGNPTLDDINDWETLEFPDLDAIDWDEVASMNTEYLGTDKVNQLGIQFGFWERLMCLMDVENAALALVDEDQEEALHAFFDKLADIYIDYINRVAQIGRIDAVMMHDDWGTNNGPFFSLDTCMKFIVPPMRRVTDACHELGIVFEHHCCGKAGDLVPAMIAAGSDYWMPQQPLNDIDELIERHKDDPFTFAVVSPLIPVGSTEEDVIELAREWVEKYKDAGILMTQNGDLMGDPRHDNSLYPVFAENVYRFSREAYQDLDD